MLRLLADFKKSGLEWSQDFFAKCLLSTGWQLNKSLELHGSVRRTYLNDEGFRWSVYSNPTGQVWCEIIICYSSPSNSAAVRGRDGQVEQVFRRSSAELQAILGEAESPDPATPGGPYSIHDEATALLRWSLDNAVVLLGLFAPDHTSDTWVSLILEPASVYAESAKPV